MCISSLLLTPHLPPSLSLCLLSPTPYPYPNPNADTAHGASIAMAYDEVLAYPVWRTGGSSFTANLSVNFRARTPLRSTLRFEARIVKVEGRKHYLEGKITSGDQKTLYTDATGLWIKSKPGTKHGVFDMETILPDKIPCKL